MSSRCMGWCAVLLALNAAGCILDDDRCGAHQQELRSTFEGCVCAHGFVPDADGVGCHACGEHEEARDGSCVCSDGFARANEQSACVLAGAVVSGQDTPCTDADGCQGFDADFCAWQVEGLHACFVSQCGTGARRCASDRDCCVITTPAEVAAAAGLCVPRGECPEGVGMVVTP